VSNYFTAGATENSVTACLIVALRDNLRLLTVDTYTYAYRMIGWFQSTSLVGHIIYIKVSILFVSDSFMSDNKVPLTEFLIPKNLRKEIRGDSRKLHTLHSILLK
jgi:hypothetical protein